MVQTATFGNSVAGGEDQELWNRYFKQFLFSRWYLKWLNSNKANRSKLWGPPTRNQGPECPPVSTCPEPTQSERVPVLLVVCGVYCKKSQNIKRLNRGILPAWEQAGKQFKEQKNSCLWGCPVFLSVGVDIYVSLGKMMAQAGCLIGRWLAVIDQTAGCEVQFKNKCCLYNRSHTQAEISPAKTTFSQTWGFCVFVLAKAKLSDLCWADGSTILEISQRVKGRQTLVFSSVKWGLQAFPSQMSVAEAKWDHYQLPDSVILLVYSGHQEESDKVHNMYFEKSLSGGIFNLRMCAAGKKILTMSSVCLWSAQHTAVLGTELSCAFAT